MDNKNTFSSVDVEYTEKDIKKAYWARRLDGMAGLVFSLGIFAFITIYSFNLSSGKDGITTFILVFFLCTAISMLFYFYGLRCISIRASRDGGLSLYIKRARFSLKIIVAILLISILAFLARFVPPNNRVEEIIIANAQIINYSYFDKEKSNEKYFITVKYGSLKIECNKSVYDSIDPNAADKKNYGYKLKYSWSLINPKQCKLLSIEKMKVSN